MTVYRPPRPLPLIAVLVSTGGCSSYWNASDTIDAYVPESTSSNTASTSSTGKGDSESDSGSTRTSSTGTSTSSGSSSTSSGSPSTSDSPTFSGTSSASESTTFSSTSTSGSTGEPTCGDDLLEDTEECDDGNTISGDGCSDDCTRESRRVFVTSATFDGDLKGNGKKTSLEQADKHCNDAANAGKLEGAYRAWLSTQSASAGQRLGLKAFAGHFVNTKDGEIIAYGWAGLTQDPLVRPIQYNEQGALVHGVVWTNTNPNGSRASANDCYQWRTTAFWTTGVIGKTYALDQEWSTTLQARKYWKHAHLYCFQVEP